MQCPMLAVFAKRAHLQPWQLLVVIVAGWINRQQQEAIEYLRTENEILREAHGKKRILLNDDQRRRLAVKGKILGRKVLGDIAIIVTPDRSCAGIGSWSRRSGIAAIVATGSDGLASPEKSSS